MTPTVICYLSVCLLWCRISGEGIVMRAKVQSLLASYFKCVLECFSHLPSVSRIAIPTGQFVSQRTDIKILRYTLLFLCLMLLWNTSTHSNGRLILLFLLADSKLLFLVLFYRTAHLVNDRLALINSENKQTNKQPNFILFCILVNFFLFNKK